MSDTADDLADDTSEASSDAGSDTAEPVPPAVASCTYVNPFSQGAECKRYTGAAWTAETAAADCLTVFPGTAGTLDPSADCDAGPALGDCVLDGPEGYTLTSSGADSALCDTAKLGCETFAKGDFVPAAVCDDGTVTDPDEPDEPDPVGPDWGTSPFIQPYEICVAPNDGEAPGLAEGGDVCTFMAISACTEPGRRYADYVNCGEVRTQRPYYGFDIAPTAEPDDVRLADTAYMAEVAWVKEQVEACACVCCHAADTAPKGPSGWSIDAGPLWIDTVPSSGLAMLAGLADSATLGAFEPSKNNGFARYETGLPTTDVPRMQALLTAEYIRRGFTVEDGQAVTPFGGPIYSQSIQELAPCAAGEGVDASGQVTWAGEARYLYVLAAGSKNPGVPPNLDEPDGTLWFIDVPPTAEAFAPPLTYGSIPEAGRQRVPVSGDAPALVPGETYAIYALFDIGLPVAACTFTAAAL